jgi:hypothetical protein
VTYQTIYRFRPEADGNRGRWEAVRCLANQGLALELARSWGDAEERPFVVRVGEYDGAGRALGFGGPAVCEV